MPSYAMLLVFSTIDMDSIAVPEDPHLAEAHYTQASIVMSLGLVKQCRYASMCMLTLTKIHVLALRSQV